MINTDEIINDLEIFGKNKFTGNIDKEFAKKIAKNLTILEKELYEEEKELGISLDDDYSLMSESEWYSDLINPDIKIKNIIDWIDTKEIDIIDTKRYKEDEVRD